MRWARGSAIRRSRRSLAASALATPETIHPISACLPLGPMTVVIGAAAGLAVWGIAATRDAALACYQQMIRTPPIPLSAFIYHPKMSADGRYQ